MCVEKSDTHCVSFIYNNYIIVKHMNFIHWRAEFKGRVHPKTNRVIIYSPSSPILYVFSSAKHIIRYFEER